MTVVVDDLNLKSLEENGEANCQSNGQQVCLENVESQLFSAKDEINLISIEMPSHPDGQKSKAHEVHFDDKLEDSSDCVQSEGHQLQTQHSEISRSSYRSGHQSFRLAHRASFLSTYKIDLSGVDDTDSLPETMSFTRLDELALIFSIFSFVVDILTDSVVATNHYLNRDYWYFAFTITFIAFPALVMTCINLRWYIVDSNEPNSPKATKKQWLIRVLILSLQLGPVMRYYDSLKFGREFRDHKESDGKKSRMARKYFQYMIYEDADATMLRLFECFLEAAPQLILQMYILAVSNRSYHDDYIVVIQLISVIASLISLSWSLVSYLRILRVSLPSKVNMTWPGTIVHFFWRFFMIASRVLALALFASQFTHYIGIVCLSHWLIMFIWIIFMKTAFCNNLPEELFYNAVLAVIFIFCYFNPVDSPTRRRYTFYYTFIFSENTILIYFWHQASDPDKWYRFPGLVGFFVCFFLGLVFMIIYYLKLHPTNNIGLFRSQTSRSSEQPVEIIRFVYSISNIECANGEKDEALSVGEESSANPRNPSPGKSSLAKYKRQFSDVWTTKAGRLLHPRPNISNQLVVHST